MAVRHSVGVLAAGSMHHSPVANTIATQTLAAPTDGSWVVSGVYFGFDQAPALTEEFELESPSGDTHMLIPVDRAGSDHVDFDPPLRFPHEQAVIISLSADTGGARGYVAFKGCWVE